MIEELLDNGTEIKNIASILKRAISTVAAEIKKNGGKRLYNAEKAQENSENINKKCNEGKNLTYIEILDRLKTIEMKLENMMKNEV